MKRILFSLLIFSIAMAYLEGAVVLDLRALFYTSASKGLKPHQLALLTRAEFWREIATIVMLVGAGLIAGRTKVERFGLFLYCFGIWDIFYYVFLKVLMNWPTDILDWDLLFLVPVPWIGPVLAPCLVSLALIGFGVVCSTLYDRGIRPRLTWGQGLTMLAGCAIILYTFMKDYINYAAREGLSLLSLNVDHTLVTNPNEYLPKYYDWPIFLAGFVLIAGSIAWMAVSNLRRAAQDKVLTVGVE